MSGLHTQTHRQTHSQRLWDMRILQGCSPQYLSWESGDSGAWGLESNCQDPSTPALDQCQTGGQASAQGSFQAVSLPFEVGSHKQKCTENSQCHQNVATVETVFAAFPVSLTLFAANESEN